MPIVLVLDLKRKCAEPGIEDEDEDEHEDEREYKEEGW